MYLTNQELTKINGGALSSTINSMTKIFSFFYDLGKSVGNTIRNLFGKNYC